MESEHRICLINPPPQKRIERWDNVDYPHLGIGYLAAYLKNGGYEVGIIDAKFERIDIPDIEQRLLLWRPDIVGITAMTHEIERAAQVAAMVKGILPESITVVGGAHATALPAQTLDEFTCFDIAVFGEGEYTFLEMVNNISKPESWKYIPGIAYRKDDGIQKTEPRDPIMNPDELPFPAWELYPRSKVYPVITARGCPFRCNFCMRILGNTLRKRSPENVIRELENVCNEYKPAFIHFVDEAFTIDKNHASELLDSMISKELHTKFKWDAQTRADVADADLLQKMKAAGCEWIGFGVESGNERILAASGKGIKLEQAQEAVRAAKKAGIKTDGFFILGHPDENAETVKDTVNFATKLNTTTVTFGLMVPYPGTRIYEMAMKGEGGYRLLSQSWQDFNKNIGNSLELTTLSRKQMETAQVLGYLRFYLYNFRFIAGAQYLFLQRRLAVAIIKKLLRMRNATEKQAAKETIITPL